MKKNIASLALTGLIALNGSTIKQVSNKEENNVKLPKRNIESVITDKKYTVKKGDTLNKICLNTYGDTTLALKLAKYNGIANADLIYVGDVITLPSKEALLNIPTITTNKEKEDCADKKYTVKKGDTLNKICLNTYGDSTLALKLAKYNGIANADLINVGDVITLPSKEILLNIPTITINKEKENDEDEIYIVKKGDTLYGILSARGLTHIYRADWKLATYNGLENNNCIYVGEVLLIPNAEKLDKVVYNDYSYQDTVQYEKQHNGDSQKYCPRVKVKRKKPTKGCDSNLTNQLGHDFNRK